MELFLRLIEIIEKIGPMMSIVIVTISLIVLFIFNYLITVLQSYSNGGLLDGLKYGKYEVKITYPNKLNDKVIVISAWNRTNAVEKAAKKLGLFEMGNISSFRFEVNRFIKNKDINDDFNASN